MKALTPEHIKVVLKVLESVQQSDFFWEDSGGRTEPKPTKESEKNDKLLDEAVEILRNNMT